MLVEFASAVDAVRNAVEIQRSMAEQNAAVPQDQRIEFRIGIHVGDIILMIMISSATASILLPALKASPNRAGSACPMMPIGRFEARSRSPVMIWDSSPLEI